MSALVRLYRGQNNIFFPKWWRRGLIFSGVLVAISLLSLFTRGLNLGIDFEGGISWQVKAPGVSVAEARSALGGGSEAATKIQIVGTDTLRVESGNVSTARQNEVRQQLADLGKTSTSQVDVNTVGPSWGRDITHSAEKALVIFLIALLIYLSLRLEWKMAVGAILAMIHDVIISVGVYSVFQLEVTPETVVAFLTILGYSIYDTIVVFDKIKENLARPGIASRLTFTDLTSLSMNQVLMRSINTSVVALIPVISMLVVGAGILGAVTLEQFAFALLVGLTAGAYSSIFVAAPIVVWLKEREPRNRMIRERVESSRPSDRTTGAEALALDTEEEAEDANGTPLAASPTASRSGVATAPRPTTSSAIPPRPRKNRRRR